jgi:hypothetical protein
MESDTCVVIVKKDEMINLLVIYVCFMDVPIRYKKRHFKKIWHEKLEKYINDLKG